MDNRLFNITARPGRLRRQDLPIVARALVSLFRKQATLKTGITKNVGYVRIEAVGFQVQILQEDWNKILPSLKDDFLNQVVFKTQVDPTVLYPVQEHEPSIIDRTDQQYYTRTLQLLQELFTEAYPTSQL